MKNIGITGQSGFIGYHLSNTIKIFNDKYKLIDFEDNYFENDTLLENFVKKCDVIVHLAAVNRHENSDFIYHTNIELVKKLIKACEKTNSKPHILFSSSIQEELNNAYGKSKIEGRKLFENFAKNNNTAFTALIIPNVFGPFCKPFYNSFIATFCHQIANGQKPQVIVDSSVKLIYVSDLIKLILELIDHSKNEINTVIINHNYEIKVSETLKILENIKNTYLLNGIIPDISEDFINKLFKTFITYINLKNFYPFYLTKNSDNRGCFVEIVKTLNGGQFSFSTTHPGITRGNHFHTRKFERFAVIKGNAQIQLRKIDSNEILTFHLSGEKPSFVDIPVWYTHNITNIGTSDLYTIFWCDEFFNPEDGDTFFEEVTNTVI